MSFSERVYELCKKIPKGRIITYGEIAKDLNCKCYRAVGQALRRNSSFSVPCHRVVKSDGGIGGFRGDIKGKKIEEKIKLLEREGVKVRNGKIIEFEKKLYKFKR